MDSMNLMIFVMSGGFTLMFALILILWNHMNKSFDKLDQKIDNGFKDLCEKIHHLDTRLSRVEGILHSQDCCVIKASNDLRKAE